MYAKNVSGAVAQRISPQMEQPFTGTLGQAPYDVGTTLGTRLFVGLPVGTMESKADVSLWICNKTRAKQRIQEASLRLSGSLKLAAE